MGPETVLDWVFQPGLFHDFALVKFYLVLFPGPVYILSHTVILSCHSAGDRTNIFVDRCPGTIYNGCYRNTPGYKIEKISGKVIQLSRLLRPVLNTSLYFP